jgi:hypothetical protein
VGAFVGLALVPLFAHLVGADPAPVPGPDPVRARRVERVRAAAPAARLRAETVASRLAALGPGARASLAPHYARAGVAYPGASLVLLALKAEHRFELYATDASGTPHFIKAYPITATSGRPGPKLRTGDRQIPEGVYDIAGFNPNSSYHLSLHVGYPNAHDRRQAAADGRTALGGDIMIHGGARSIGCVALGDAAIEEIFVVAADVGRTRVQAIFAPTDLRRWPAPTPEGAPAWVRGLYASLAEAMAVLPVPPDEAIPPG